MEDHKLFLEEQFQMTYDVEKLKHDIDSDHLESALEILQNHFIESKECYKEDMYYLNQIITKAIPKNNIVLAIKAAVNRLGWLGYIEVPESASWSAIISAANADGSFDELDFNTSLLKPSNYGCVPSTLNHMAVKLWGILKENDWNIPDIEVLFDAYGRSPRSDKHALLLRKVEGIRGTDFFIGFSGIQGRVREEWNLNNTAGFSFIAISNFCMTFFEDGSGPTIYKYNGADWPEQISKINSPHFSGYGEDYWEEVECRIPRYNEIYPSHFKMRDLGELIFVPLEPLKCR